MIAFSTQGCYPAPLRRPRHKLLHCGTRPAPVSYGPALRPKKKATPEVSTRRPPNGSTGTACNGPDDRERPLNRKGVHVQ